MNGRGYTVGVLRYAITGSDCLRGGDGGLLRLAARWAANRIDFVQLREKQMDAGTLTALARKLVSALGPRTKLLVNGRADVAIVAGAAGVHLTAHPDELTPEQVRRVFALAGAPEPIVSVSCHTPADVERARDSGADLILFGPVFEKRIGDDAVIEGGGLEMLRKVCEVAGAVKVFALGGVTQANAQQCVDAGATGVAGIRLFGDVQVRTKT
jgi:thiamine-phosphate pyrophosphorylase